MRRSLRDSIVGFSLLGGILVFTFFSFWLRGVKLSSKNWYLFAEFNNASGLSKKSPVTYRGILVGSIEDIIFTNESIKAKIVVNNPNIILPKPAFAKVVMLYGGKFRWAGSIDEFKESNDPYVFQFRNGNLAGPMQPKDI